MLAYIPVLNPRDKTLSQNFFAILVLAVLLRVLPSLLETQSSDSYSKSKKIIVELGRPTSLQRLTAKSASSAALFSFSAPENKYTPGTTSPAFKAFLTFAWKYLSTNWLPVSTSATEHLGITKVYPDALTLLKSMFP